MILTSLLELSFAAGIPLSGGSIGVNLQTERLALVNCVGNENRLRSCRLTSTALSSSLSVNQQARVRCFDQQEGEYMFSKVQQCIYTYYNIIDGGRMLKIKY